MNIKQSVWMATLLIAAVGVGAPVDAGESGLKGSRPNVFFFLGDDQSRFDHATYGNTAVPTPTTEAFAKEGLVFEKAFTGQAICAPSRSMLNTGLYPIRNGCFINHTKIRKGVKTLPQHLKALGYTVILAGKSHVGPGNQFTWSKHFQPVKRKDTPRPWIPIEEIDAFLADPGPNPFCIMVTSEFPHPTYFSETPYKPEDVAVAPYLTDDENTRRTLALYYRSIQEKEAEFAALLASIEKHGMKDNSVVFYSDDHGLHRGKFTTYDSGLNMAFMVRWPEKVKPGRTDALTSFTDFVPTMIELAGGTPKDLDGKSLLPILEKSGGKHHDYVYGVTVSQGIKGRHVFPQRSVHDGRYHYIRNFNTMERIERDRAAGKKIDYFLEQGAKKYPDLPEEMLFDTQADPYELTNLAQKPEMAKIKQQLKTELFRWMAAQNDYLTENGPIPFLGVNKRFSLDQMDKKYYAAYSIPKDKIGSLKGKTVNPHEATAPKAK